MAMRSLSSGLKSILLFISGGCAILFLIPCAGVADVVAYYTFDGHVRDATGDLFDGTAVNVSYSTDVPSTIGAGQSAVWGDYSVSRYVSLPVVRGLESKFSVTCWAKTPSGYSNESGGTTLLANSVPQAAGFQWYLNAWNSDNRRLTFATRNAGLVSDTATTENSVFIDNDWHHLALVRDGAVVTMYVDGVAAMTDSSVNADFPTDLALRIGHNIQSSADQNWCGNLDDFAIWDEVLTSNKVAALAVGTDSPAAHLASPVRAVAYYPFDGNVEDESGLDYHGTAVSLSYDSDVPAVLGSGNSLEWGDHTVQRYVDLPRLVELNTEFSITCWAKTPSGYENPSGGTTLLANSTPQVAGFQWYLNGWNSDNRRLTLATRDVGLVSDAAVTEDAVFTDGQWHHLALVREGASVRMYVDGAAVTMTDGSVHDDFTTEPALRIGHNFQASADQNWCGNLDDFAVWNGALSANVIAALAAGTDSPANHLVPSWWTSRYVGEMDGFYRYGTMTEVWLKNGGGLQEIPEYLTRIGDFPYQLKNTPSGKEGVFIDHWFLVRALGGWNTNREGTGEYEAGTFNTDYDVAYWDDAGNCFAYRWNLLFERIDPYLTNGYSSLTLVTDGIPWDFTTDPEVKSYGNYTPPDDLDAWQGFMEEMGTQLVDHYGSIAVGQMRFRVGTELRGRLHFTNETHILKFYDYTSEGLAAGLPAASRIGMWNYAGALDAEHNGVTNNMVAFVEHCGSGTNYRSGQAGSLLDWQARSIYSHKLSTGQPNIDPFLAAPNLSGQMADLEDTSGFSVPWEVHELGITENEYELKTNEEGAYGAAWYFNFITQLYCGGFSAIQHWGVLEKIGSHSLLNGHGWVMMVLDHLRGGEFFMLDAPATSAAGTKYGAFAVDCGAKKYVLLSAFNADRTVRDECTVTIELPRGMMSLTETSTLQQVCLTMTNSVYDVIRNDLENVGRLASEWAAHDDIVATVSKMGGTDGVDYVDQNWSTYQQCVEDSLTLQSFGGSLSSNQLSVTISAPSVLLVEISPGFSSNSVSGSDETTGLFVALQSR